MTNRQWLHSSVSQMSFYKTLFFCNYYQWQHKLHVVAYVNKKWTGVLPRRLSAQYENEREASKLCVACWLVSLHYNFVFECNKTSWQKKDDRRRKFSAASIHSFSREEKPHFICSKDRNIILLLRFKFLAKDSLLGGRNRKTCRN
jgi:hypothetical protein